MSARSFDINKINIKQSIIRVIREDVTICVQLHDTVVVAMGIDQVILNSGGWKTNTTKTAINRALSQTKYKDIRVFQKAKKWYVSCPNEVILTFVDGMVINL